MSESFTIPEEGKEKYADLIRMHAFTVLGTSMYLDALPLSMVEGVEEYTASVDDRMTDLRVMEDAFCAQFKLSRDEVFALDAVERFAIEHGYYPYGKSRIKRPNA